MWSAGRSSPRRRRSRSGLGARPTRPRSTGSTSQSAAGTITPIEPEPAGDGIDEFLTGFAARRRPWPWDEPRRLELHAADSGRKWHVQIGPERVEVVEPTDDWEDDCLVAGPASDLLLLLWNRMSLDELAVSGDAELLGLLARARAGSVDRLTPAEPVQRRR